MLKNVRLARAISFVIATSGMAVSGQTIAQEQAATDTDAATALEPVTVTGSRIRHDKFTSAEPVDVVVPETAAVQGQDLESVSGHSEVRRWRCQGCPPGLRVNL